MSDSILTPRPSAPVSPALDAPFWFSGSMWTRFAARTVLASWLMPVLFALLVAVPTTPAQAQVQSAAEIVVVLDFAVANGLDPLLGRKAADGLAVELQRSGDFEVVPRARVEEVVAQRAGLQPPFNDTAQIALAQAVGARSIFSGRVLGISVRPGREARVVVEGRQLDAATGDFINGTQVTESTEQKLQSVPNEILIDEALNKAVFSAVRSMRQTNLPVGPVLNTTTSDIELGIGARNGVSRGQRYSVLRDVFNPAKKIVERNKIGEVTIVRVESDQSVARLTAGGNEGVRTGDRVRKIFVPGTYPVSISTASGSSVTPVTAPPTTRVGGTSNSSGIGGFVQKSGRGLLGLVGVGLLVGLAGFGGGSASGAPDIARDPREANPDGIYPRAAFTFRSGIEGISTAVNRAQQEAVIAYLVFRGSSPNFSPDVRNLQEVIDARFVGARDNIPFTDLQVNNSQFLSFLPTQIVTITGNPNGNVDLEFNVVGRDATVVIANTLFQTQNQVTITYTPQPYTFGESYFYSVGRITAERVRTTATGADGSATTAVTIQPVRSSVGAQSGRYTPLFRPEISDTSESTTNFVVNVDTDLTAFDLFINTGGGFGLNSSAINYTLRDNVNVTTGADLFRVEVSRTRSFDRNSTFISRDLAPPANVGPGGIAQFTLGAIQIPALNGEVYQPGQTLFVRVLSRNTNDAVEVFRVSPTVSFVEAVDPTMNPLAVTGSRFLASPAGGRGGGIGLGRIGGAGRNTASGAYTNPRVMKPR